MPTLQESKRDDQIAEFWDSVRRRLTSGYDRKPEEADRGIGEYRLDMERRGIGDAVYNQGVDRTAEVVDGVIKNGLPMLTVHGEFWDRVRRHLIEEAGWPPARADREIGLYRAANASKEEHLENQIRFGTLNKPPDY